MRVARISGFVCSLLLAACGAGPQSRPHTPASWREVQTPHFCLSTNLAPAHALEMAQTLEETRAALLGLAWTGAKEPRGRTDVVVFARPSEFDRHSGQRGSVAGIAVAQPGFEPLLSFSPGPGNGLPVVAVHEMAHDLSRWFMPLQPPWLAEGLAAYMEGLRFDRATRKATLGEVSKNHVEWLESTGVLVRTSKLFALDTLHHGDVLNTASFYASSWLLVHYLLNMRSDSFGGFQSRLAKLEPWRQAWDAEFLTLSHEALDQNVLEYSKAATFTVLEGEIAVPSFTPRARALSAAEVHGVLARQALLVRDLAAAERERAAAVRLDPNEVNALLVEYHLLGSESAAAKLEIARRAVRHHPKDATSWLLKAEVEQGPEQIAALERASELAPDHPKVRHFLARAALERGDAKEALQHSRIALRRSVRHIEGLAIHVRALAASGRCREAATFERNAEQLVAGSCSVTRNEPEGVRPNTDGGRRPIQVSCSDYLRELWDTSGACRDDETSASASGQTVVSESPGAP